MDQNADSKVKVHERHETELHEKEMGSKNEKEKQLISETN